MSDYILGEMVLEQGMEGSSARRENNGLAWVGEF